MNGIGADIWGTSDQFRYAYKTLTGNGTIVARVHSIANSNTWAKAGVMIRQSTRARLDPRLHGHDATRHGRQRRQLPAASGGHGASTNDDAATAVTAPYWVKVERAGDNFTGSISPDGVTWTQFGTAQTIAMTGPVLIGLAVCSHDAARPRAEFSDIKTTGNVTRRWQIGGDRRSAADGQLGRRPVPDGQGQRRQDQDAGSPDTIGRAARVGSSGRSR